MEVLIYLLGVATLDAIHDEPEYQAIIRELEADLAARLQHVREMQANGELESIPM